METNIMVRAQEAVANLWVLIQAMGGLGMIFAIGFGLGMRFGMRFEDKHDILQRFNYRRRKNKHGRG